MNEYSRVPIMLRQSGMLSEVYTYSEITSDPVPRKAVDLCTSHSCAAHFLSGVVTKSRNGYCVRCNQPVLTKLFFNATLETYEKREELARRNYEAERKFNESLTDEKRELRKRRTQLIKALEDGEYFYLGSYEKRHYKKEVEQIDARLEFLSKLKYRKMEE